MKELKITIEIDAKGQITADAEGFTGEACIAELQKILEGLPPPIDVSRKSGGGGERNLSQQRNIKIDRGLRS